MICLHNTLVKFIKKDVMAKVTSMPKLAGIDVTEKENILPAMYADTGFATSTVISEVEAKKKTS